MPVVVPAVVGTIRTGEDERITSMCGSVGSVLGGGARGATPDNVPSASVGRAGTASLCAKKNGSVCIDPAGRAAKIELRIVDIIRGNRPDPFCMRLIGRARNAGTARLKRADVRDTGEGAEKRDCGSCAAS